MKKTVRVSYRAWYGESSQNSHLSTTKTKEIKFSLLSEVKYPKRNSGQKDEQYNYKIDIHLFEESLPKMYVVYPSITFSPYRFEQTDGYFEL